MNKAYFKLYKNASVKSHEMCNTPVSSDLLVLPVTLRVHVYHGKFHFQAQDRYYRFIYL